MKKDVFVIKRHTCIMCSAKRIEAKMTAFRSHWACKSCLQDPVTATDMQRELGAGKLRVLNLYAGLGGNRHKWPGSLEVTAVEFNPKIAAEYKKRFPEDTVIVGDAHRYLEKNYYKFDFIWSSPPCQTHSRMGNILPAERKRYVDMSLYQEIIFLRRHCKTRFVVENVIPYYEPLIKPDYVIERHCFWSNFVIDTNVRTGNIKSFITCDDVKEITDWLGIDPVEKNIYLSGHSQTQVYRNCCHPVIGVSVLRDGLQLKKQFGIPFDNK